MAECLACGGEDTALAWKALQDSWVIAHRVHFSGERIIVGERHYTRAHYGSLAEAFIAAVDDAMIARMENEEFSHG